MLSENTGNNDYDYNLHSRVDNDSYSFYYCPLKLFDSTKN